MTDVHWADWVKFHGDLFRWDAAPDVAMMNAWRAAFEARGFTADELKTASMHLAQAGPPKWRDQFLEALLSRISSARLARMRHKQEQLASARDARCTICSDVGLVIVPHPRCVFDGEWSYPWYSCVVACNCEAGRIKARSHEEVMVLAREAKRKDRLIVPPRMWTIEEYEARNPGWLEQSAERKRKREAEQNARAVSRHLDTQLGAIGTAVEQVLEEAKQEDDLPY